MSDLAVENRLGAMDRALCPGCGRLLDRRHVCATPAQWMAALDALVADADDATVRDAWAERADLA